MPLSSETLHQLSVERFPHVAYAAWPAEARESYIMGRVWWQWKARDKLAAGANARRLAAYQRRRTLRLYSIMVPEPPW